MYGSIGRTRNRSTGKTLCRTHRPMFLSIGFLANCFIFQTFERGLHERYEISGQALEQFILAFRTKYPLMADKLTPDEDNDTIDQKEARNVLDGYALYEAAFIDKKSFPYDVKFSVVPNSSVESFLKAEVSRLRDTFDAISDLSLAEGVFQVTQGNYNRAGAMLNALSQGSPMPEPEIVRTPRSGTIANHKVSLHFTPNANANFPWSGNQTPRAIVEKGMNEWLGGIIGLPDTIKFELSYLVDEQITTDLLSVADLNIQPIDLIYM